MKKILLLAVGLVAALSHPVFAAGSCQTVYNHLAEMAFSCPSGQVCFEFKGTLESAPGGSCQLSGDADYDFTRSVSNFTIWSVGGYGGLRTPLPVRFVDTPGLDHLSFTHRVSDSQFRTISRLNLSYREMSTEVTQPILFTCLECVNGACASQTGISGCGSSGGGGGGEDPCLGIECAIGETCVEVSDTDAVVCVTMDMGCPEGQVQGVLNGVTTCVIQTGGGPNSPGIRVGMTAIPDQSNSAQGGGMCQLNAGLSFDGSALNLGWIALSVVALAAIRNKKGV